MKLLELFSRYSNERKSKLAFKQWRDKQGVVCKKCQGKSHYWKKDKWQYECKSCGFRTTLRSGTVMESSNLPYQYWMLAMGLLTATKKSFSALEIQRQLGHKRYEPIWAMLHKIRVSMGRRDDKYKLDGCMEIDEGYFEGHKEESTEPSYRQPMYSAYGNKGKRQVKVLVMIESEPVKKELTSKHKPKRKAGYLKMKVIEKLRKDNVNYEVKKHIEKTAKAITDGGRCYSDLEALIAQHEVVICKDKTLVPKVLPWVHIAISNAKKICLGVHHSINRKYMQNYLNEYCYKFNRRYFGDKLFDRLMVASVEAPWYAFRYDCG
jgi:hypothetical protein